jgi:hypothetical protein
MKEKGMHLIRDEKNIYIQLMLTPTTITRTDPISPLNLYMFPKRANHQTQHSLKQDTKRRRQTKWSAVSGVLFSQTICWVWSSWEKNQIRWWEPAVTLHAKASVPLILSDAEILLFGRPQILSRGISSPLWNFLCANETKHAVYDSVLLNWRIDGR